MLSFKFWERRAAFGTKGHFHEHFAETRRDEPWSAVPYLSSVDLYHGGELYGRRTVTRGGGEKGRGTHQKKKGGQMHTMETLFLSNDSLVQRKRERSIRLLQQSQRRQMHLVEAILCGGDSLAQLKRAEREAYPYCSGSPARVMFLLHIIGGSSSQPTTREGGGGCPKAGAALPGTFFWTAKGVPGSRGNNLNYEQTQPPNACM